MHLRHPVAGETTLYLVRHGRTAGNYRRLLQGRSDVPLDGHGRRQAACIAGRLAALDPIDVLISSPLRRALTTAGVIGDRLALTPVVVPDLSEIDFGRCEGMTFERMVAEHPEVARRLLDADDFDVAWPHGESRRGFYDRIWRAFQGILTEHATHRVLVVAHGGVIGAFLALVQGRSPNDPTVYDLANCSLTHLHVTTDHTTIHLRNDVCHLELLAEPDDEAEAPA